MLVRAPREARAVTAVQRGANVACKNAASPNPTPLTRWAKRYAHVVTNMVESFLRFAKNPTVAACKPIAKATKKAMTLPSVPGDVKHWKNLLADLNSASSTLPCTSSKLWTKLVVTLVQVVTFLKRHNTSLGVQLEGRISAATKAAATTTPTTSVSPPSATTPPRPPTTTTAPCTSIPYNQLVRDPASLVGQCVTYEALVYQYTSRTGLTSMLIDVTRRPYTNWTGLVEVTVTGVNTSSVYQTDIVRVVGVVRGAYTYTTASGGTNTVPAINLRSITVLQPAG